MKNHIYMPDLAHIHDTGFSDFSKDASIFIMKVLAEKSLKNCRVVELGCGSGTLAKILANKGYSVHGIDLSPAMIRLAKNKVPKGKFVQGSLWDASIPECEVVLSIGECLNYEADVPITKALLKALFLRVHSILKPGGIFIFDILCESNPDGKGNIKKFTEGKGWLVAVEIEETFQRLTRKIITFRKIESGYRRSAETHHVKKHNPKEIINMLQSVGFGVIKFNRYNETAFLRSNHFVFMGLKRRHS
ncbi:MAG: class I SAM-dependent methyltransferase [Bacillota bacterium]